MIQTSAILETVFKAAVAAADAPILLGTSLLRSMLDRQHDQVSGIQTFTMSLKVSPTDASWSVVMPLLMRNSTLICATSTPTLSVSSGTLQRCKESTPRPRAM